MSIAGIAQTTCPGCGSSEVESFLDGNHHKWLRIERAFHYFLCRDCQLRFQPVEDAEAKSMFADIQDVAPRTKTFTRGDLHCEQDVLQTLRSLGFSKRLLDIGSGDGRFLAAAKKMGFDCLGTDVSQRLAESAQKRSGVPVMVGDVVDLDLPADSFDVINLDCVLMYVAEPRKMMRRIARLLRPGGILRLREFDPQSLSGRLKGKRYWAYAPTHVTVWPGKAVEQLARSAGLRIHRVYSGTEASLGSWLETRNDERLLGKAAQTFLYGLRKMRIGRIGIAADTVYYLQRPVEGAV
jgi:SAM-dependent methyltransferase